MKKPFTFFCLLLLISFLIQGCSNIKLDYNLYSYKHKNLPKYPGYEKSTNVYVSPVYIDIERDKSLGDYEYSYQLKNGKKVTRKLKLEDTVKISNRINLQYNEKKVNSRSEADLTIDFDIEKFDWESYKKIETENDFNDICAYRCKMVLNVRLYGDLLIDEKEISHTGDIEHFCTIKEKRKTSKIEPVWKLDNKEIKVADGFLKSAFLEKYFADELNKIINEWLWKTKIREIERNVFLVKMINKKEDEKEKEDKMRTSDLYKEANKNFFYGLKKQYKQPPASRSNNYIENAIDMWEVFIDEDISGMIKRIERKKQLKAMTNYNLALANYFINRYDTAKKHLDIAKQNKSFLNEKDLYLIDELEVKIKKDKKLFDNYVKETKKNNAERGTELSHKDIDLLSVEGGCYDMGQSDKNIGGKDYSNDEQPVHKVCVNDFLISKKEVTIEQYLEFMNEKNFRADGTLNGVLMIDIDHELSPILYKEGKFYFEENEIVKSKKCPVTLVTWHGAKAYAEWSGGRLPTEAEWEYAAQGEKENNNYRYSGSNKIDEVAWYGKNSEYRLKPVASKKANALGLYDMSGNASEWCNDWYDKNYYSESENNNPKGAANKDKKVYRGGSSFNLKKHCRVHNRHYLSPESTGENLGFRVVFDKK